MQDLELNGPLCKQQQFEAEGYLNRALRSRRWGKSAVGKDAGHSDDYSLIITIGWRGKIEYQWNLQECTRGNNRAVLL